MGNGLRKNISEERWGNVRTMLEDEKVQQRVQYKWYNVDGQSLKALHLVLKQRAPADIVRIMLNIDGGQATRQFSSPDRELPLHTAVRHEGGFFGTDRKEIVAMLVSEWPDAIKSPSGDGNLPLHIACSKRRSIPILRLLVGRPDNDDPVVDEEAEAEKEQEEDDLRNALNADGLTPWEIIKKESRFWEVIYRMRARKLLKERMLPDDQNNIEDDEQEETILNGEVFHSTYENEESMLPERRNDDPADGTNRRSTITSQDSLVRSGGVNNVDNGVCVLCWDGPADHILIPCGHICLCGRCCRGRNISSLKRKCPVCNKSFDRKLKVYFAGVVSES